MNLDNYQIEAVKAKEKNILVVAAPGSGKTTVIINRIKYLVENNKIDESNIIVITFTKAAAMNMKNRYVRAFNKNRSPFFGTFHGLFYKILTREGYKINIIEGYIANKIIESVLKKYFDEINEDKIKEAINNISLFKTSMLDIEDFKPSFSKDIFKECYEAYSKYKKEHNLMDFDDLAIEVIKLFKENDRLKEGYRRLFKYILVDEFQDCDDLQMDFLKMMIENGDNSLFAVGDEDQCIYSFRGSKPRYMVIFDDIFENAKKYYLSKNYRSNKNIIDISKKLIKFNKERNNKKIVSNKQTDGIINFYRPLDEREQGERITKEIKSFVESKQYYFNDNIILYRTNIESMSMVDNFIRNKIPFKLMDKEFNFYNHFICRDLIDYLKVAVNNYDIDAFCKIINKPFRYISKINIAYLKDYKEKQNPFDILINKSDTPPFQRKKLEDLKNDFAYINKVNLNTAIQYIIMDLGYIDYLKEYSQKFGSNIEDLEEIMESFKEAASSYSTITTFFEHIKEVSEKLEESKSSNEENRVLLSTIHGVKGMEFKNVYIINCNEDTIPHISSKDNNIEEERRLFYVGITRAIDNLFIYAPKNGKGKSKEPSRFIKEGGFLDKTLETHGLVEGVSINHRTYGLGMVKKIDGDDVRILFEDGIERRFSGRVLVDNNLIMIIK